MKFTTAIAALALAAVSPLLRSRIRAETTQKQPDNVTEASQVSAPGVLTPLTGDAATWLPNPFYKPLNTVDPQIRRALLTRIFRHALDTQVTMLSSVITSSGDSLDASRFDAASAKALLKTNQEFEVRKPVISS